MKRVGQEPRCPCGYISCNTPKEHQNDSKFTHAGKCWKIKIQEGGKISCLRKGATLPNISKVPLTFVENCERIKGKKCAREKGGFELLFCVSKLVTIFSHFCHFYIPCLADIFLLPYLCQLILTWFTHVYLYKILMPIKLIDSYTYFCLVPIFVLSYLWSPMYPWLKDILPEMLLCVHFFMYIYVCTYIHLCRSVYIHPSIHAYIQIHVCMSTYMHIYMYRVMHVCLHTVLCHIRCNRVKIPLQY